MRAIYDTLTALNEDGELSPYLAKSVEPNDDFTEWTITLREGVKFHDGADLDRPGRQEQPRRLPRRGTRLAAPLLFTFMLAQHRHRVGVDPLTVPVTDQGAVGRLPGLPLQEPLGIIGQAQLDDKENCDSNLIGTGPFELASWTRTRSSSPAQPRLLADRPRRRALPVRRRHRVPGRSPTARSAVNALERRRCEHHPHHRRRGHRRHAHRPARTPATSTCWCPRTTPRSLPPAQHRQAAVRRHPDAPAIAQGLDREELNETQNNGLPTMANGPFATDSRLRRGPRLPGVRPAAARSSSRVRGRRRQGVVHATTDPDAGPGALRRAHPAGGRRRSASTSRS